MTADHLAPYSPHCLRTWSGPLPGFATREGTLVFADVSGFTRLTERLARQGKVGAEEMVLTISSVWEALLADGDGGDVLKFAGDALVLFYEGEHHALRACARAVAMQRELRRVGRIETLSGVVRLRMSIGVHSGEFHFFVLGRDHLDLAMPGPATTRTLEMEKAAGAGQVVVSRATADLLGPEARFGDTIGDGVILRRVPAPIDAAPEPVSGSVDPARFVAPSLQDRLGHLGYEHRWAAVGFVHLGHIDARMEAEDPAPVFERVQEFTVGMMDTLAEHEVLLASCDLMSDGAGFMLAAGVPQATGDDAAAMLAVGHRLVGNGSRLAVRVGINAGNVFVGEVGPSFRRAFVTMGDTTNLAARVMARAEWGTALATNEVLRLAEGRFATRPIEPFQVKGKRRSVEAALVGEPHQAAVADTTEGPLVGRQEELAVLDRAMKEARAGRGSIVEIVGDQGTGRSRLVSELADRADGMPTVGVTCDPFERTSPYRSARHLLRQLLGISSDASSEEAGERLIEATAGFDHLRPWLPLVAAPIDARVDDTAEAAEVAARFRRARTQQAVADLAEAVVDRPTLVAIEDAGLMDDASAELLAVVLGRIDRLPWLVVITRTDDTAGLHPGRGYRATLLSLAALPLDETRELAMRLTETLPVPRHLIGPVVERSGGNPLFLRELLAGAGEGEMPHNVEGIIASRIDSLPPDDRQALRYLSVLGDQFPARLVDETLADLGIGSEDSGLWSRLAGFVRRRDGRVSFVNPLVHQVAYEGLTFDLRRRIHSAVAESLAHSGDDTLPVHLLRGERWREAWYAAWKAGERAERAGANAVAAELFDLALEVRRQWQPPGEEVWQVATGAGECWARAGMPDRALADYAVAIAHAPTAGDRLRMAAARAAVHEEAGRFRQALTLYTRAMREAADLPADDRDGILAVIHAGYASTRQRQGRDNEAIDHARLALEHARTAGDQALEAQAHHLLDRLHTARGETDEALRHRDAALPLFAVVGDLAAQGTVLHDLAADAHRASRLDEAAWLYARAVDARTRAGDVGRAATSTNALGEVAMLSGDLDRAEEHFTEALRTWRGARSPHGVVVAATNLGELNLLRGQAAVALEWLEEAVRRAAELGGDHPVAVTQAPLAEAFLQLGRHVEAWAAATLALQNGTSPDVRSRAHRIRAAALAATGGQARAEEELAAASALSASSSA